MFMCYEMHLLFVHFCEISGGGGLPVKYVNLLKSKIA